MNASIATYILHFANGNSIFVDATTESEALYNYELHTADRADVIQPVVHIEAYEPSPVAQKPLSNARIATELIASLLDGEGTMIDRYGEVPTKGYVVGVTGISSDEETVVGFRELVAWVAEFENTQYYYNAWRDAETGKVFYDAAEIYSDPQEALRAGMESGEIAIWDLANDEEIRVEYNGSMRLAYDNLRAELVEEAPIWAGDEGDPSDDVEVQTSINGRITSEGVISAAEALWAIAVEVNSGAQMRADHDSDNRTYRIIVTDGQFTTVYAS